MSGEVSANLAAIIDMAARLEARAIDRATDREIPGGDAMVNLAGVANLSVWGRRNDLANDALLAYEDPDELWSPFQMLAFWSEQWRVELGMDHDDPRWRPSIATEAAFLRNPDVLAWAWDNELHWDDFAADVRRAKARLEGVLVEGERADLLRVRCPDCVQAAEDAENAALSDERVPDGESHRCDSPEPSEGRTAPRLIAVYGRHPDEDRWKCPACRHKFDADQVRRARVSQMRQAGDAARWMPVADAVSILRKHGGWREKLIREWANDQTEVSASTDPLGVKLVWWPDMWRLHRLRLYETNENQRKARERRERRDACRAAHGDHCWTRRGCSEMLARTKVL